MKISGLIPNELICSTGPAATLVQGTPATPFNFQSIPDLVGRACNHIVGLLLTLSYNYTQAGGTGVAQFADNEIRQVLDSVKWEGGDLGDLMEQNNWRGAVIPFGAYLGAGYSYPGLFPGKIPAANGVYARNYDIFLPVPAFGCGNPLDSIFPTRFVKNSRFTINCAAASIGTTASPGSSIGAITARLTALTVPLKKIRLGVPFQQREYVKTAVTSGQFAIEDMGIPSGLDGVEDGCGLAAAYLETTANGLAGAVAGGNVTQLGLPRRSIVQTTNVSAFIAACMRAQGLRGVYGANQDINTAGAIYQENFFPFVLGSDRNQAGLMNSDLGLIPLGVDPGFDMNLSNLQQQAGAFPIQLTASGISGDHRVLTVEAKRWKDAKRASLLQVVRDTARGGDLAAEVLGSSSGGYRWNVAPATPRGLGMGVGIAAFAPKVTEQAARYLPYDLQKAG